MKPFEERFWKYVDKSVRAEPCCRLWVPGVVCCWLWTGGTNKGYGKVRVGRRDEGHVRVHRAAYEMAHGKFDESRYVCHTCDAPLCVRAEHLFLDTQGGNMADAARKGRMAVGERSGMPIFLKRVASGEIVRREKLCDEDVITIRELDRSGISEGALARRFGASRSYISMIVKEKRRQGVPLRNPVGRRTLIIYDTPSRLAFFYRV